MIDPYIVSAIAIFLIGTILLTKTSAKRYLIFFMIHTRRGMGLVEKVANLSPSLWKFLGDLAIVISFGGFGSFYVSRYRNTWKISAVLGVVCLIFTYMNFDIMYTVAGIFVLVFGMMLLKWSDKPILHFLSGVVLMGLIMFNIYPNFSNTEMFRPVMSLLVGIVGIPALLISMLFLHASKIVVEQSMVPGVSPLLPTISDEGLGFYFPGTGLFIPFWQAVIAIICLLVPHEFAHGVLTRAHNIKLKSAGVLTVGPLPIGAFVEPDDKDMKEHKGNERMRMY
ncbi:MAG: hypothetical protein KAS04_07335, partial [Candidatus Aenigmarchaeota archaeon]|nr:hypothetical protein [Candidatus Aenigmarchaeota archaeon]